MARDTLTAKKTFCLALMLLLSATSSIAATFTVNTVADSNDTTPGDGVCADAGGACSLRAAIDEANALAGADVVTVGTGNYVLTQGQLNIKEDMTLTGGSSAATTVIDANAGSRVLSISETAASVTLENLTIRNGLVSGGGAGIGSSAGRLVIRNLVITQNVATGDQAFGGGLAVWKPGTTTIVENSVVSRNTATHGGGIMFANNSLELRNSAVIYNRGSNWPYYTAGVFDYSSQPSSLVIENSTIAGNEGGAIKLYEALTTIVNSTIAGNLGSGIRAERNSNVTVSNSILYGNGPNCSLNGAVISSGGHNIDGRNSCGFASAGDQVNIDPMLGPLADNGGPTPTRGLVTGSPALNAGDNSTCLGTDQRGTARSDGSCDIGAFEGSVPFATCLSTPLAVDSTTDAVDASVGDGICDDGTGACTLRAAIQEANACIGEDVVMLPAGTYSLTIGGIKEDAAMTGDLDIRDDLSIKGSGATATIIDASDAAFDDRIFHVLNNVTTRFSALTLQGVSNNNLSGGCIATGGDLQVSHAVFSGNSAGNGTGIYATGSGTTVSVADSTLSNNNGNGSGAGIYVDNNVTLTVSDSIISNNVQPYEYGHQGAAIRGGTGATLNIVRTLIDNNSSGYASSVYGHNNSVINIDYSTVSNSQGGTRGVVGWDGSTVNINRSTISGNLAGGVATRGVDSSLNITDSTISNNEAHALGSFTAQGGGADIGGAFTITGSSIFGNRIINDGLGGSGSGAGLYIAGTGSVSNTTLSGNNNGGQNSRGGAIGGPGNLMLVNSTVYNNYSRYGGGIGLQNGTLSIANSIVAGNSTDCDASYTAVTSNGHNIESQNTCGLTHATDLVNTDPLLDVLADNGGWTQTHALLAGSPALDAGDATICADAPVNGVDQRGFTRPWGSGCDIGAYEDMPLYPLSLSVAGTGSGRVVSSPGAINCQSGTCITLIGENTRVILTAMPDSGSQFGGWSGDCVTTQAGKGSVLVDADKTCTATFNPVQHTLSVIVSPLGSGWVEGVVNYATSNAATVIDCGADCTETLPGTDGVITLFPRGGVGWDFVRWDGCDKQVNTSRCEMTLNADKVLTAYFVSADIYVDDAIAPVDDRDMPFGEVVTGKSVKKTVTITNKGKARLSDIWVQDSDYLSAPFSMLEDCSDISLEPGESCQFTVSFTPTAAGTFSDSFDIISEDPDEPVLTITVSGTGVKPAPPVAPPDDSDAPLSDAPLPRKGGGGGGGGAFGPLELLLAVMLLGFRKSRKRGEKGT